MKYGQLQEDCIKSPQPTGPYKLYFIWVITDIYTCMMKYIYYPNISFMHQFYQWYINWSTTHISITDIYTMNYIDHSRILFIHQCYHSHCFRWTTNCCTVTGMFSNDTWLSHNIWWIVNYVLNGCKSFYHNVPAYNLQKPSTFVITK